MNFFFFFSIKKLISFKKKIKDIKEIKVILLIILFKI